eukprot:XP_001707661.1 VSP [Giardia lamblia ATCC 50803]
MTCKASGIVDCTTCEYNPATGGPKCTACNGAKIVKEEADGTTTCIDAGTCTQSGATGENFLSDGDAECILCSNDSSKTDNNKGSPGCGTCSKNGAKPECKTCLDGYYDSGNGNPAVCVACAGDCGKCGPGGAIDTCEKCKPGFFLKNDGTKKCVPCDDPTDGVPGCATCTLSGSFTCDSCKVNYQKKVGAGGAVTCVKTCEDPTACGGTAGACDAMIIDDQGNTKHYCSYCGETNKIPIDGKCVDSGSINGNTCNSHTCTSCAANYFLYMGGCYKATEVPGSLMCKTADNGVCTAANANNKYFVVPGATNQNQSVLACGNPLGTLVGTQGTAKAYVGVDGCSQCTAPAAPSDGGMTAAICTSCDNSKKPNRDGSGCVLCPVSDCKSCVVDNICEECVDGLYFKAGETPSCVSAEACTNEEGFFIDATEKKCTACADDNCAVCAAKEQQKCSRCKTSGTKKYLMKDGESTTGTCVDTAGCPATHYVDEEAKECNTCVSGGTVDCTTCEKGANGVVCKTCTTDTKTIFGLNRKSCVASCPANSTPKATGQGSQMCECNEGLQPNTESTECQPISNCNTEHCLECTGEGADKEVCTKCLSEYYLTPTSQCVSDCTTLKGYYGNDTDRKCKKCNDACVECKGEGADKCTACPAGRMLQYTDADTPANGGTCMNQCSVSPANDGCAECGAQIGGTAYCSKCKNTQQAPLDGNCAANTRTRFCTTVSNGACTQCENNYFLKDGGCYQTDRQPGKQVCTTVQGGKCTKCASGLTADNGDCSNKRCHLSCETCTAANDANACATCSTGYYKPQSAGTKCNPCSEGLAGCRQCTVSSTGAFMCLVMGDGTGDNTGGSVNRGGLSTGAIAGISVAVIVVVGGLVGFLCWWFICRGKA